jgi:glutathione S-transferase
MELYDRQDCPYSKKVREKLEEVGVEYEETVVPDKHTERTRVKEITGDTGVPVLVDDGIEGGYIADSGEIVSYLEERYG